MEIIVKNMKKKIKKSMDNIYERWKKCTNKAEYLCMAFVLLFSMFTMFYSDFQGTFNWAYQGMADLFKGKVGSILYLFSTSYGMTLFALLFLWLLPFVPFSLLTDFNTLYFDYYGTIAGAVWSKLFLCVVIAFMVAAAVRIANELGVERSVSKWLPLFLLTSANFFIPVVQISQCDIVSITFALWGIYYYLKDDRKRFLMIFAFAIPMKYFPLLIFIPLVLLHEKKIVKIITELVEGVSLLFVNIILRRAVRGNFIDEFSTSEIGGLVQNSASVSENMAEGAATVYVESNALADYFGSFVSESSFFVVLFILICILAYAVKKEEYKKWSAYISAMVFLTFLIFGAGNAYRMILAAPFMALVVFCNKDMNRIRLSMILETIIGWGLTFLYIFESQWLVGGEKTFSYLFLNNTVPKRDLATFFSYIVDLRPLLPYAYSCVLACVIGFLLINIPSRIKLVQNKEEKFDRWIIRGRIAVLYIWVMICLYVIIIRPF